MHTVVLRKALKRVIRTSSTCKTKGTVAFERVVAVRASTTILAWLCLALIHVGVTVTVGKSRSTDA
jgi:hypothetical protein